MPDKTERLTRLLPQVYAARFGDGVLFRLLDAFGAELANADTAVKRLLSSHWVNYAEGQGLDGLAATFGDRRRILSDGTSESDSALRQRLRSLVPLFTGGGTVRAVVGVVRSALGLPFDMADLPLPPGSDDLRTALAGLVTLTEFSPDRTEARAPATAVRTEGGLSRLDLVVRLPSVRPERPAVQMQATLGIARNLSVKLDGTGLGVRAGPQLALQQGEMLVMETDPQERFVARVVGPTGHRSVGHLFTALDGVSPASLPPVPGGSSTWIFRAGSGFAADQWSAFDEDTFDLPLFDASLTWTRYQPLTIDVLVPYFLRDAVQRLCADFGFEGQIFVYEGLPLTRIQEVVDATRAAGVRARVSFSLHLPLEGADRHDVSEQVGGSVTFHPVERADARELLTVGSISSLDLIHDQNEQLRIGAVFDVSSFDDAHQGFLG